MTNECNLLHIQAHGDRAVDPTFASSDDKTKASFAKLAEWAARYNRGIATPAIIADGCSTATGVWQKAVRDCLQGPITYVGTSRAIGWYEGTVFTSMFYARLLRNRGVGVDPVDQAFDAAEVATRTYTALTEKPCPYKVKRLTPSRNAKRIFG